MYYTSGFWKRRARAALQNHWLTALLIALIVSLPSLLVQTAAAVTGNDLLGRLQELMLSSVSAGGNAVDLNRFQTGLEAIRGSTGIWVMQGLYLAAWLLTPCLTLGQVAWLLGRLRGQEDPGFTGVFSRMKLFFRGILLRLYVALRMLLLMLPGIVLAAAAMLPLWLNDGSSRISLLSAANTAIGLEYAAMIATAVLGVVAALRYALSDMCLADHPDWGAVQAAKESRRLTQGKKGQLFGLYASFILWYLLGTMAASVCHDLFGPVPSLMVQMLASLALSVYLTASVCAFYLGQTEPESAGAEEETEELNG